MLINPEIQEFLMKYPKSRWGKAAEMAILYGIRSLNHNYS